MASISIIPKVKEIHLHTNNVISWNRIKKKPVQSSSEEILECTKCLIHCWKKCQDETKLQYTNELDIECAKHRDIIKEEERDDIRVTAKIWLYSMDSLQAETAVNNALEYMSVREIDTLIVSFPPNTFEDDSPFTMNDVRAVWSVFERCVEQDRVLRLGVSDMNLVQLEHLYDIVDVKPVINQVNLASSCSVPDDLVQFANDNAIQLLTHNDAPVILPNSNFQSLLSTEFSAQDGLLWNINWVIRYSFLYKNRGVIRSKAYMLHANRDIKKLPYC